MAALPSWARQFGPSMAPDCRAKRSSAMPHDAAAGALRIALPCFKPVPLPPLQDFQHSWEEEAQQAEQAGTALNAALASLTQLTSLQAAHISLPDGLPALAGLHGLRRLCLFECEGLGSLPEGGWCSRLQELGADSACLQHSCGALAAARQLRLVVLWIRWELAQPFNAAMLRWAAQHPPLQQLLVADDLTGSWLAKQPGYAKLAGRWDAELAIAVQRLQHERPGLQITHGGTAIRDVFQCNFSQKIEVEI